MLIPVSPWITLTPGTPVRATSLCSDPEAHLTGHALVFQQCPGNTGLLYVFNRSDGDKTGVLTGTSVIIPAPTYNNDGVAIILPHAVFSIPGTGDAEDASQYWVDGSESGKVAVSLLVL